MKIVPVLAAMALAMPTAAIAQSLDETHVRVWHPSGKTPGMTYSPRSKSTCAKIDDHRAGKGQYRGTNRCPALAETDARRTPAS